MTDLRYPVGKFVRPASLSGEERAALIDVIAAAPEQMAKAVAGLNDAQLDTPYRDGGWTVRQVVHHVVDSHVNSYIRTKFAVAEDNPTIIPYNEAVWANFDDAAHAPVEGSLTLLTALHARWVRFFRSLDEAAFARTLVHPENGVMDLDFVIALYAWHGRHHIAHVTSLRRRMGW